MGNDGGHNDDQGEIAQAEILRVQSRRAVRQRRVQIGQHIVAAFILINFGIEHGGRSLLSISEIAAGALLIASVIRERFSRAHHGGIAWVEFAGALMAGIEAGERTRGPHHVSFVILAFVQPVVLLLFAMFDTQIAAARYLKADDDGFEARLRLFFRRRVAWDQMRGFRVDGNAIEVDLGERKRKISLRDVVDRDAAMAWAVEQFRKRSVPQQAPGGEGDSGQGQ
ncbi:MAG: hypothetical protein M3041_04565 [Acidobacteriota bacterium]|nr:hypothetical protein [Acidobacteriota bacterium]